MIKIVIFFAFLLITFLILGIWHADRTNPYSRTTEMKPEFTATLNKQGQFVLRKEHPIILRKGALFTLFAKTQAALRIIANAWSPIPPIKGNETTIIQQIHMERFDPSKAYLISGEHFADFYPRNYGLFYNAVLDSNINLSYADWENKQKIMLQTTAFYLDLLSQSDTPFTTYMPLTSTSFVGVNVWSYPSDSLYSVLFQLSALTNNHFIEYSLPKTLSSALYPLQTKDAGTLLLKTYSPTLKKQILSFEKYVLDSKTGLVKKHIFLSGVRDGVRHESSFYDNVMVWATAKLASDLGIIPLKKEDVESWKQRILTNFWDQKDGIFIDDLSEESKLHHIFPADAFIITQTQFLDPTIPADKDKIIRIIEYVKNNHLDKPFPLIWSTYDQSNNMVFLDRYLVPNYEQQSIFSHWTMEYIKLLVSVSKSNPDYISDARNYLNFYHKNIQKYGGYPEIYFPNGNIFKTALYKSVLHTGWIINYEQTKMMILDN